MHFRKQNVASFLPGKIFCLCVLAFFILFQPANATIYLQEGFNYTPGTQLGSNAPWTAPSSKIIVGTNALTWNNLTPLTGNSVFAAATVTTPTYRPFTTPATNGLVYCSFLINLPTAPGNTYICGMSQATNVTLANKAANPCDFIDDSDRNATSCYFGVRSFNTGTAYSSTSDTDLGQDGNLNLNTTAFIVLKYDFSTGNFSCYFNPVPGDPEPATPDITTNGNGLIASDLSNFYIRNNGTNGSIFYLSTLRIASTWAEATPSDAPPLVISPQAYQMLAFLDSLRVDQYWIVGTSVNFYTGSPGKTSDGPNMTIGTDSHCSAFAAAAADFLNIYMLRPPAHSDVDLANAQADWFVTNTSGWYSISNMLAAQEAANAGNLVIGSYKASSGSGHIAILRASTRSTYSVNAYGPEECQSGDYNYFDTNVVTGFSEHPGAFPSNILYYGHAVSYPISPVVPVLGRGGFTNHAFQNYATTFVGRKYQVQWSTNLVNWNMLLNFTNSNNNPNYFTNAPFKDSSTNYQGKFYRILAQ